MRTVMKKKYWSVLMLMLLMSVGFAKPLAKVGNINIDSSEVDNQVKLIVKNSGNKIKDSKQLRHDILQKLISREVIFQEARRLKLDQSKAYLEAVKMAEAEANKKGITNDPSFKRDFESYKKVLLADIYALDFLKKNRVTDKEVKAHYDSITKFYQGSDDVKVGEILVRDATTAQKALAELNAGTAFAKVGKKYTIDPNRKSSGGIYDGYINLKDMQAGAPEYYAVIHNLKKGQFTKASLKSGNNYVIVGVIDRKPTKAPSFDGVKNSLKQSLSQEKLRKESERLNKVYNVRIY